MIVEKNDVDVRRLFSWGTVFELSKPGVDDVSMVYMRLIGDEDMNKARVYALRESKKLRDILRDRTTDESIALIPSIEDVPKDDIVGMVAMFSTRALSKQAIRDVSLRAPREPKDNASLEEHEEHQVKIDTYQGELEIARMEYVKKGIDDIKKRIKSRSPEEIYEIYVGSLVNEFCELRSLSALRDFTTYYGTFSDVDYKHKYFDNLEQLTNLPTHLKNQFLEAYMSLEIGGEELKKSQGATQ